MVINVLCRTRPRGPLRTFKYDARTRQALILPVRKLEMAVQQEVVFEKTRRMFGMIKQTGLMH